MKDASMDGEEDMEGLNNEEDEMENMMMNEGGNEEDDSNNGGGFEKVRVIYNGNEFRDRITSNNSSSKWVIATSINKELLSLYSQ